MRFITGSPKTTPDRVFPEEECPVSWEKVLPGNLTYQNIFFSFMIRRLPFKDFSRQIYKKWSASKIISTESQKRHLLSESAMLALTFPTGDESRFEIRLLLVSWDYLQLRGTLPSLPQGQMEVRCRWATAVKLNKLFSEVEKWIGTFSVSLKGHQMSNESLWAWCEVYISCWLFMDTFLKDCKVRCEANTLER